MEIKYLGHSSLFFKGKSVSLITDPYDSALVGLKYPKHLTVDIVTLSHDHPDHSHTALLEGEPFIVSGPGEYEIKNVGIVGISVFHDEVKGEKRGKNTIYRIEIDGLSLVHLGDLGHTLSTKEVDQLGNVDILFVPTGGHYTIDAEKAAEVVAEVEPSIVVPMHYKTDNHSQKDFGMLSSVDAFLKAMGKDDVKPQPKLVTTKEKLPAELQVVVLE